MSRESAKNRINRRQFLAGAVATGVVCGLDKRLSGETLGFMEGGQTILETSFEKGQPVIASRQHSLVEDMARTGKCSMMGEVTGPNQARFLEIPFESKKDKIMHVSFWVRSDKKSACAVFVRIGKKKEMDACRGQLRGEWGYSRCYPDCCAIFVQCPGREGVD
ncbi:MAG: hypothetical protein ACYS32_19530 [Planctomycetota bacterium]|jgi:hypothetical protein